MIWGTGGPKARAQVFSKQMVYFMCFHYLFLFSGIKVRREIHTLPPILKIPAQIFQSLVVVSLQRQTQGMMTFVL